MKKHEKYLEVLKTFTDYVTIEEWANEYIKSYPADIKDEEKSEKEITRSIVKSITALVTTGKWSNMLLIDKSVKPQKIKYTTDTQRQSNSKDINLSQSIKDVKSVKFEFLMQAIKHLDDDEDLPSRSKYTYFEKTASVSGYKEFIAFEMAIRNKDVIEITQKLDYLQSIIENDQLLNNFRDWLLGIVSWEEEFDGEAPEDNMSAELKKEYMLIAELPITMFEETINSLGTAKELTNEKSEGTICFKIIADHLQAKLIDEYHIYKDGYYFITDGDYFDKDEVVDSGYMFKDNFNAYHLEDKMKLAIDKLINRKTDNLIQTADMFFMYDYYTVRETHCNLTLYVQDIKSELTKYHGIKIQGLDGTFKYDDCLERYEEFKGLQASFYEVEKTIVQKIELMKKFIDEKQYKYILFY